MHISIIDKGVNDEALPNFNEHFVIFEHEGKSYELRGFHPEQVMGEVEVVDRSTHIGSPYRTANSSETKIEQDELVEFIKANQSDWVHRPDY